MMDQKILELTALYEISKAFASSLDLKVASNKVIDILSSVLGMRRGTLTLLHPETEQLGCLRLDSTTLRWHTA